MTEEEKTLQTKEGFDLVDAIITTIKSLKCGMPYHFNLIDELHINENGHSRILYHLLQYKNSLGEYVFLKSLFKYIAEKCNCGSFGEISVIEPYIPKPDTCRIDLWVLGDDFAVIFENKAYNANDQEAQIRRYIDITLSEGYKYKGKVQKYTEDQIYVVYLPQTDAKDPDAQTWLNEGDDPYFDIRTNRYAKTSFRSVILTWLKEKVLPEIPRKDELLECAIVQYIDYLEGVFKLRKSDKEANDMVEKFIEDRLDLTGDPYLDQKMLNNKFKEFENINKYLYNMEDGCKFKIFELWREQIDKDFSDLEIIYEPTTSNAELYVNIPICGSIICVGLYKEASKLYCGLSTKSQNDSKEETVTKAINPLLTKFKLPEDTKHNSIWYGWKYIDWGRDAYQLLFDLINEVKKIKL